MGSKGQETDSSAEQGLLMTSKRFSLQDDSTPSSKQGLLSGDMDEQENGNHQHNPSSRAHVRHLSGSRRWSLDSGTGRLHVRYGQKWHASYPLRVIIATGVVFVFVLVLIVALSVAVVGRPSRDHNRRPLSGAHLPHGLDRVDVDVSKISGKFCTTWSNTTVNKLPSHNLSFKRPLPNPMNITRPDGFKIVGLIFFGRPRAMDIFDCYLQQNLVSNGGLLDEVRIVAHTKRKAARDWLDEFVKRADEYKRVDMPENAHFGEIWRVHGSDPNTMFIKMDDDLTWLSQDAIPHIVQSRLEYKEPLAIAANLINAPMTSWVHHRLDAVHAFLPENERHVEAGALATWRPSELPEFSGPLPDNPPSIEELDHWKAPYEGHRWLPLRKNEADLWRTPITMAGPAPLSASWHSWTIAAQQHMSLLQNIENDELWRYSLSNNDWMIHTQYKRYNVNFVAIWGEDVAANLPVDPDDEEFFTVTLPRRIGRPILLDTRVLVAHFSFFVQADGMAQTDILDRYRAYANEAICPENKQRVPVDRLCNGF